MLGTQLLPCVTQWLPRVQWGAVSDIFTDPTAKNSCGRQKDVQPTALSSGVLRRWSPALPHPTPVPAWDVLVHTGTESPKGVEEAEADFSPAGIPLLPFLSLFCPS